jgi:hypothetical protein
MRREVGVSRSSSNFYAVFMPQADLPHVDFIQTGARIQAEKEPAMCDLISLSAGAIGFALMILYVPACERV